MGKIHISARAVAPPPDWPVVPFLAVEASPSFKYSLWKAGNFALATPARFETTDFSSAATINDYLADVDPYTPLIDGGVAIPETGCGPVLYSRVGHNQTPKRNSVRKLEWDDSANVELFSETGGEVRSLTPCWHPAGSKIVFRAKATSGTLLAKIKTMDPDGTNVTDLYEATTGDRVYNPTYNYDGTLIAWFESPSTDLFFARSIKCMNADGTGVTTVYAPGGTIRLFGGEPCWMNGSNVIAFLEGDSSAFSADRRIRKINSDGTGVTTLITTPRGSGYSSSDVDPPLTKWSWLPDDSALAWTKQTPLIGVPTTPEHSYGFVDAGGGGWTPWSPAVDGWTGTFRDRPAVLGDRIYFHWQENLGPSSAGPVNLASVALDGTDFQVEFDGDDPGSAAFISFYGFKGDTLN